MKQCKFLSVLFFSLVFLSCKTEQNNYNKDYSDPVFDLDSVYQNLPQIQAGDTATQTSKYIDKNDEYAVIPKNFYVSEKQDEQTISTGLVIIGEDKSEFVWVPVNDKTFKTDELSQNGFFDQTDTQEFYEMKAGSLKYGGFYIGRFETSKDTGNIPRSKRAEYNKIWVHIPPTEMIKVCANLYADNDSVTVFLPWGITWDRTLLWLVETGCKTLEEVRSDSSSWGNYANNSFNSKYYSATGAYEETKANNIYDLAGNTWEWTQERTSSGNYAARSGGYQIMGGPCNGNSYPAAVRSGLPSNDHHPNITFRLAMWVH